MPRTYGITNSTPYSAAPAVGNAGDTYFDTTAKLLYVSDGTSWNSVGLSLIPNPAIKTASYTAVAGEYVSFDCTSGNRTLTLPLTPPNGTLCGCRIQLLGTPGNFVSINTSGTDKFNSSGGSVSLIATLTVGNQGVIYEYQSGVWYQIASGLITGNMGSIWQAITTLTTKGDLYVATAAGTVIRQGVGANGQALVADSAQTNGVGYNCAPLVFASTTARNTALPSPIAGQMCITSDTGTLWQYTTATTGWQKPWSSPWGLLAAPVNNAGSIASINTATDIVVLGAITPVANRYIRITARIGYFVSTVANDTFTFAIQQDSSNIGTVRSAPALTTPSSGAVIISISQPSAASHVWKLSCSRASGTGTGTVTDATIFVEDIGPSGNPA